MKQGADCFLRAGVLSFDPGHDPASFFGSKPVHVMVVYTITVVEASRWTTIMSIFDCSDIILSCLTRKGDKKIKGFLKIADFYNFGFGILSGQCSHTMLGSVSDPKAEGMGTSRYEHKTLITTGRKIGSLIVVNAIID